MADTTDPTYSSNKNDRTAAERQEANREYAHQAANQSIFKTTSAKDAAEQQQVLQETGPYLTLGIQLALSIIFFYGIGYWIDHSYGTGSRWSIIFVSFGAIASLAYFIVTVLRLSKIEETKGQQKAFGARQPDERSSD